MNTETNIKTLVFFINKGNKKRVLIDYLDKDFLENYEIEDEITSKCPFDIPFGYSNVREVEGGYLIEIFDKEDNSMLPKQIDEIKVEVFTVLEIEGKIFKLEEI
jgi:hypothetical protein